MPLFKVTWSKAYYRNGETIIAAATANEAMDLADQQIGNWEGSLQYCPDDNQIDIDAVDPEEHLTADQLRERDDADAQQTRFEDFNNEK